MVSRCCRSFFLILILISIFCSTSMDGVGWNAIAIVASSSTGKVKPHAVEGYITHDQNKFSLEGSSRTHLPCLISHLLLAY